MSIFVTRVAIDDTPAEVLARPRPFGGRAFAITYKNVGSTTIYYSHDSGADDTTGFPLDAGEGVTHDKAPGGRLYFYCATGLTGDLAVDVEYGG